MTAASDDGRASRAARDGWVAAGLSAAVAVLVAAAYAWQVAAFWGQINDDAYITFRYSQFLSLGRGPYYNVGEHVEGYTNFLLMLILAAVHRVGGDASVPPAARLIGVLAGAATLVFTWRWSAALLRERDGRSDRGVSAWIAPALVAVSSAFAVNSTTGLETTLFAALITAGLWLSAASRHRRWCGAGAAFALAALTRPEGAMVFASTLLGQIVGGDWRDARARRRMALDFAIVAATVGAHVAFRVVAYDGELVPNTYTAKAGGFFGTTPTRYVAEFAVRHGAAALWLLGAAGLLLGSPSIRRAAWPAAILTVASWAAIYSAGADWMRGYRLLVPYLPAYAGLAALGITAIGDSLVRGRAWLAGAAGLLLAAGLLSWEAPVRSAYRHFTAARARGYVESHAALADWLRSRTQPGDMVAVMDIGIIGFRCPELHILDVSGLTDRTIARSPGGFLDKQYDPEYVFGRKPLYVILTLSAPYVPNAPIDARQIDTWTTEEHRLYVAPSFRAHYLRFRAPLPNDDAWERLAAAIGAERIWPHEYPGEWYLLAAFRRW